jgi:DNA mismatch repair ATPase MutS
MKLETDAQTLEDLRIFGKREQTGIFDLYNDTHTRGGEKLLREMFRNPLSDIESIGYRRHIFAYFSEHHLEFPFEGSLLDMAEKYTASTKDAGASRQQILNDKDIENGVVSIIQLTQKLRIFIDIDVVKASVPFAGEREAIITILESDVLQPVLRDKNSGKVSYSAITAFDALFRSKGQIKIEGLLHLIYLLDVYLSVARVALKYGFTYPKAHQKGSRILSVDGLFHPELKKPVANDMVMEGHSSLVFLTGANMAGKSTFLRSIGTATFLAHMGFPVAARAMEFSIMDGLYTTINLPDDLGMGASHFYAEVLRVKKIATELHKGKKLFVIFDELFRGTNVKDAHEATVAIAIGFARNSESRFIISSHIVEAAEQLGVEPGIDFLFLPTRMNGNTPEYTYTLERGVTDDRHGMLIIRSEGILDILKNGKKGRIYCNEAQ